MNDKNLNALDGSSVLDEVLLEKIESQRRSYKKAIRNAVVRNDHAQEGVARSGKRADRTQDKLNSLVEGGLEGYLNAKVIEDDELEEEALATPKNMFGPFINLQK